MIKTEINLRCFGYGFNRIKCIIKLKQWDWYEEKSLLKIRNCVERTIQKSDVKESVAESWEGHVERQQQYSQVSFKGHYQKWYWRAISKLNNRDKRAKNWRVFFLVRYSFRTSLHDGNFRLAETHCSLFLGIRMAIMCVIFGSFHMYIQVNWIYSKCYFLLLA